MGDVVARSGRGAEELDEEGEDVEEDEVEPETPRFDAEEGRGGEVVVDHAAENHVQVGFGPEGCDLYRH